MGWADRCSDGICPGAFWEVKEIMREIEFDDDGLTFTCPAGKYTADVCLRCPCNRGSKGFTVYCDYPDDLPIDFEQPYTGANPKEYLTKTEWK